MHRARRPPHAGLASQPLSAQHRSSRQIGDYGPAVAMSLTCPAVNFSRIGRPCWSSSAWFLVVSPPRKRPGHRSGPSCVYRKPHPIEGESESRKLTG